MDDSPAHLALDNAAPPTAVRLNVPPPEGTGQTKTKESMLADHIKETLKKRTGRFESVRNLKAMLADDKVKYTAEHLEVALEDAGLPRTAGVAASGEHQQAQAFHI